MLGQQHCTAKPQAKTAFGEVCLSSSTVVLAFLGPSCLLLDFLVLEDYL